ncbi:DsbA family protein [Pseudobdellovibrio exovorus]|uniref:Thiol:disulfide interchange protein dsbA n=1 Tax=Pseudobdellovibrio exovorus JSS TaxID=1184267 RepID=M4V7Y0_9BACT|nr:DsbA family protein [Pseudobdellovibrio exovorus]AGH95482.1 Thiol:disulfide interchange protein dsbA precursor [Pseudobdellovibrio exovorus JSS]
MTKKSNLLLVSLLITIGLFIYLTIHHYALKIGLGGNSLCAISSALNCDAAATSSFAEVLGLPIALLGTAFHVILFLFVLLNRVGLIDSSAQLQKTVRGMLILSAVTSVVMAIVSAIFIRVLCPFCAGTYVFSVINLILGWNIIKDFDSSDFSWGSYFGEYKAHVIALAAIPALTWAVNGMILDNYGISEIKKRIPERLAAWNASPVQKFDASVGLTNQVENPRITLVEFADFKCPHCKTASQTIDVFLKGKSDIHFTYKPYPLDGTCNDNVSFKGDGSRCLMAAYTLCAEKIAKKGWDVHHWLFENQRDIIDLTDATKLLPTFQKEYGLVPDEMTACADSTEIYEAIRKSAQEGAAAQVEGTPTIFMNGKKLPWGQFLDILKAAAAY